MIEDRTKRFMSSLVDGIGAVNIVAERTDTGMKVECDIGGPHVNTAQSMAAAHGFTLHGKVGPGRYKFATRENAYDDSGGLGLPGGVK